MAGTITLPWPAKALSPNARVHWRAKYDAGKLAHRCAFYTTKEAKIGAPAGDVPILISLVFHPKTKNRPDADNAIASMKASLDGIAAALGVNDRAFRLAAPEFGEPVKGGKVVVTIG
jgi:crossover junction endodeoxyribonuclease RusA